MFGCTSLPVCTSTDYEVGGLVCQLGASGKPPLHDTLVACSHTHTYLMNTSLFPTRSHLSPNLAITISVSFAVSAHTSIPKQPPPSPLPLFIPSSTTATLFITTCPSVRSLGFNGSRTLLHVLLSKLLNSVTPLPSFGLHTG